jgi:predicted metal-dependent peptidase
MDNATLPSPEEQQRLELEAAALMGKARTALILRHPFFGALVMKLKFQPTWTHPTAATDGRRLIYNPEFIAKLTLSRTMGLIAHEIGHCIFKHQERRGERDPFQWNVAGDLVINHMVSEASNELELPDGALDEPRFYGMSAEEIYSKIKIKNPPKPPQNAPGGAGSENPAQDPDQDGEAPQKAKKSPKKPKPEPDEDAEDDEDGDETDEDAEPDEDEETDEDDEDGDETDEDAEPDKPGENGKIEIDAPAPEDMPGDVMDDPGPDPDDPEEDPTPWEAAALTARSHAKGRGHMPAGIDAALTEQIKPTYTLTELIREFVMQSMKSDYTWGRPSRLYRARGLHMPTLDKPEPGSIAAFVDVSGSISIEQMRTAIGALQGLAEELSLPVIVACCNMEITFWGKFEPGQEIRIPDYTGGGTDFAPPFERLRSENETPTAVIYLSADLCGNFPEPQDEPPFPVLWISEPLGGYTITPPFGRHHAILKPERY